MHNDHSPRANASVAYRSLHAMLIGFRNVACLSIAPLLIGACAQTGTSRIPQQHVGQCDKLSVIQDGRTVHAYDGVLRIARRPFTIQYTGSETEPALTASPSDRLVSALRQHARPYLWASAGDYMAVSPNNLSLSDDFKLYADERGRNEFASMIGSGYPKLLQGLITQEPANDTASFIPKVAAFEQDASDNSHLFEVHSILGVPVMNTPFPKLYIAYFGTVEQFQPSGKNSYGSPLLIKNNWGACVLSFTG